MCKVKVDRGLVPGLVPSVLPNRVRGIEGSYSPPMFG